MSRSRCIILVAILLGAAACGRVPAAVTGSPAPTRTYQGNVLRGAVLGRKLCVTCHGVYGDGRGPGADGLDPPPRSFVRAVYRYRSTPTGSLPIDRDLARAIVRGLPGTDMAGFGDQLDGQDVADLVAWVKRFSPRFSEELIDPPIQIPEAPAMTDGRVERGKALYAELQCGKCHGDDGSGRGWGTEDDYKDDFGRIFAPRDFGEGVFRSGRSPRDLYRTLVTGLDGSPMPAYEDSVEAPDIYALVYYVLSFDDGWSVGRWLTEAPQWYEPSTVRITGDQRVRARSADRPGDAP